MKLLYVAPLAIAASAAAIGLAPIAAADVTVQQSPGNAQVTGSYSAMPARVMAQTALGRPLAPGRLTMWPSSPRTHSSNPDARRSAHTFQTASSAPSWRTAPASSPVNTA